MNSTIEALTMNNFDSYHFFLCFLRFFWALFFCHWKISCVPYLCVPPLQFFSSLCHLPFTFLHFQSMDSHGLYLSWNLHGTILMLPKCFHSTKIFGRMVGSRYWTFFTTCMKRPIFALICWMTVAIIFAICEKFMASSWWSRCPCPANIIPME